MESPFTCKVACNVGCSWQIWQRSFHHKTNRENSQRKCLTVSLTVNTWTANFVYSIIKSFIQQQVFLQWMVLIHLNKHGIYAQLRWKHTFPWWCDCVTNFTFKSLWSTKNCLITKFCCFLTSQKYTVYTVFAGWEVLIECVHMTSRRPC